jgi:hypothetical protein
MAASPSSYANLEGACRDSAPAIAHWHFLGDPARPLEQLNLFFEFTVGHHETMGIAARLRLPGPEIEAAGLQMRN